MLRLFPDTAAVEGGELLVGGLIASDLVGAYGSPLVVYDEATLRAQARAYRTAAPEAVVSYGTKAFPNVALMRLLGEEGIGADVSTLGELRFALAAGIGGEQLVVHGNNKSDDELRGLSPSGRLVIVARGGQRARTAGVGRTLIRVTPGIDADTHEKVRRATRLEVRPAFADALEALRLAPDIEGLHVHIGSQLWELAQPRWPSTGSRTSPPTRARSLAGAADDRSGRRAGRRLRPRRPRALIAEFVHAGPAQRTLSLHSLGRPLVILEPGRSLTRAGVTLTPSAR